MHGLFMAHTCLMPSLYAPPPLPHTYDLHQIRAISQPKDGLHYLWYVIKRDKQSIDVYLYAYIYIYITISLHNRFSIQGRRGGGKYKLCMSHV